MFAVRAAPCVDTATDVRPRPLAVPSTVLKEICEFDVPSRPICTAIVEPPLRMETPLKVAVVEMRPISDRSWPNSA